MLSVINRVAGAGAKPFVTVICSFHASSPSFGIDEFYEMTKPNEVIRVGRGWTANDLRRKERNMLLTGKESARKAQRPITSTEESRYVKVKRSMAAIKLVLHERKMVDHMLRNKDKLVAEAAAKKVGDVLPTESS